MEDDFCWLSDEKNILTNNTQPPLTRKNRRFDTEQIDVISFATCGRKNRACILLDFFKLKIVQHLADVSWFIGPSTASKSWSPLGRHATPCPYDHYAVSLTCIKHIWWKTVESCVNACWPYSVDSMSKIKLVSLITFLIFFAIRGVGVGWLVGVGVAGGGGWLGWGVGFGWWLVVVVVGGWWWWLLVVVVVGGGGGGCCCWWWWWWVVVVGVGWLVGVGCGVGVWVWVWGCMC